MAVSFVIVAFILKRDKSPDDEPEGRETPVSAADQSLAAEAALPVCRKVENVYFCCNAGMGSSVMASSILTTQLNKAGMSIKVKHAAISEVPADADLIVCSSVLYDQVRSQVSEGTAVLKINDLLNQEEHKAIAKVIAEMADSRN